MQKVMHLYLDDSGTRHPDHTLSNPPKHGHDYFAIGGILIKEEEEQIARGLHISFCQKWDINYPLHSCEIRGKHENFKWIGTLTQSEQQDFYAELTQIIIQSPILGIACVIDRQGYNNRYREKYGRQRWMLCKTSFSIVVERAAKYADSQGYKLKVFPEKCSKKEDKILKSYYDSLKSDGTPFDSSSSGVYQPLQAEDFSRVLYEFKLKEKSSPLVQFADLILWPIAIGGYNKNNMPYKRLYESKKLIDCLYLGVK